MKNIFLGIIVGTMFFLFGGKLLAAGFNLKSIGEVDTNGRQISQWWYTGSKPIFRGEASAGAEVEISIDGEKANVTADESGNWSYGASALTDGDHQIVLTSGGSNISFTLTTGVNNVNWDAVNSDSGTQTLPTAGVIWPGLLLGLLGIGGIFSGGKMIRVEKK